MITSKAFTHRPSKLISHRVCGFVLPLVLVALSILMALIIGSTMTSYGSRIQAVQTKAQTEAMLAAEAGYEKAIFWMSQQTDILGEIQAGHGSDSIIFDTGRCSYDISFHDFLGSRPVFRVTSTGISGRPSFTRIVDVDVVQETSGWAMGACRVPSSGTSSTSTSTTPVGFVNGEIINMPLHINNFNDSPDLIDISISGSPRFKKKVEMGESRKAGGTDKYSSVMTLFEDGIYFDQPNIRITKETAVTSKINRFHDSTALAFRFIPVGTAKFVGGQTGDPCSAVQLEFYVSGGVGRVRITNNCTVRHYRRSSSYSTWDYKLSPNSSTQFQKYDIYAYHYRPPEASQQIDVPITDTYVRQTFGGYQSEPGGQIYVTGNVVIGSCDYNDMVVKGKITVVASGNIWIGDNIIVDGAHDVNGMPAEDNPNVLGLIAQGVVKVVDPGISSDGTSYGYPGNAPTDTNDTIAIPSTSRKHRYQPIGNKKNVGDANNVRCLPHDTVIEAAITVGGGGWGAENVATGSTSSNPNRKEYVLGTQDNLKVHGSITEVIRGVVGLPSQNDGYLKEYTVDTRLMSGILPGDIWFSGKYIPAPAGWHDHSPGL